MKTAHDIREFMASLKNQKANNEEKKAIAFCEEKVMPQIERHAKYGNKECHVDVPLSISINDVVYCLRANGYRCNRVRSMTPDANTCEISW